VSDDNQDDATEYDEQMLNVSPVHTVSGQKSLKIAKETKQKREAKLSLGQPTVLSHSRL